MSKPLIIDNYLTGIRIKRENKPAEAQPSNEGKLLVEIRDALRSR